jgi:N-acetylneuraminate lyase
MLEITGILPALLTPLDEQDNIRFDVTCDMVEWQLTQGISGLYILGGTGEGLLLSEAERRAVAEVVVKQVRGRVPVIVHVGAMTTRLACSLAAHAEEVGADATSAVPPFYFNVGAEGIKQHYRAIGRASSLPFYIYNVPGATGQNLGVDLVRDLLATMPTLRGMKYTAYDYFTMRKIIEMEGGRLNIISGADEMMIAALAMGAQAAIGTTQNFLPRLMADAFQAELTGDIARAEELQARINRVVDVFLQYPSFSATKQIMAWLGFPCGAARLPNLPLTEAQRGRLREMLEEVGFFAFAVHR